MPSEDYGFLDKFGFEFWTHEEVEAFEQAKVEELVEKLLGDEE